MNKNTLTFLFVGLLLGLIGGLGIGSSYPVIPEEEKSQRPIITAVKNKVTKSPAPREKELLMEAIKELDLTTAELKVARDKLEEQEESVRRYNWLMNQMKDKGFNQLHMLSFGWNSYEPNTELLEFFGWDEETTAAMKQACKETSDDIKNWEAESAAYVETAKDELVYDLPAAPADYKEKYMAAMEEILPEEDFSVLHSRLEKQFEGIECKRRLSLTIGPAQLNYPGAQEDNDKLYMIVSTTYPDGHPSYHGTRGPTSYMSYQEGRTVPAQWNHIFNLEADPDAGDIYYSGGMDQP